MPLIVTPPRALTVADELVLAALPDELKVLVELYAESVAERRAAWRLADARNDAFARGVEHGRKTPTNSPPEKPK